MIDDVRCFRSRGVKWEKNFDVFRVCRAGKGNIKLPVGESRFAQVNTKSRSVGEGERVIRGMRAC
jgi:hypothetical protein